MSLLRVTNIENRTGADKVIFPFGIGVTNGVICSGVITATGGFVGSGVSLTGVKGSIDATGGIGAVDTLTGITTIFVGTGLSFTESQTGIVSLTSSLPSNITAVNARITGIATLGEPGITTINALGNGEIRAQGLGSLIRQSLETRAELTAQLAADFHGAICHTHDEGEIYFGRASGEWTRICLENHVAGVVTSINGFSGGIVAGVSTINALQSQTVNASGIITATSGFVGDLTGNADTATTATNSTNSTFSEVADFAGIATAITLVSTDSTDAAHFIIFSDSNTGNENPRTDSGLTYNPSSNTVSATFNGNLTGDVTGDVSGNATSATTAGTSSNISITTDDSTAADKFIIFAASNAGDQVPNASSDLKWNPNSNTLTASVADIDTITGAITFDNTVTIQNTLTTRNILPDGNGTRDIGATGTRYANVFTSDIDLNNEQRGGNSIDGTWGSYLIQEGEDDLFIINRRNGKKYKFNLTEV